MTQTQFAVCVNCNRDISRSTHGDNWWGAWTHDHNHSSHCTLNMAMPYPPRDEDA